MAVDLDGTLVLSDTLHESLLAIVRRNPLALLLLPFWLLRGKAYCKREIARRAVPDVAHLPYHPDFLGWLRVQHGRRPLLLCTAADAIIAERVAAHLGLFDAVLASDGRNNLAGATKAQHLKQRFGARGFDYAGNSRADLAVWQQARQAIVVNASPALIAAARDRARVEHVFARPPQPRIAWLRALRPHQWSKNLLLFVPLLTAHVMFDGVAAMQALTGFVSFCLCSAAGYVLNDLLDLDADRAHPRKRQRPFASGALPLAAGAILFPALLAAGFALACLLPQTFVLALAAYTVFTVAYSLRIKRWFLIDAFSLSALFTLRIAAGAFAIAVPLSPWLVAFSLAVFLSLALLKRAAELVTLRQRGQQHTPGRGYHVGGLHWVIGFGAGAGLAASVVLALYPGSDHAATLYARPLPLLLLAPLLLAWLARVWWLTCADDRNAHRLEDPVQFAQRDGVSWLLLALALAIVLFAAEPRSSRASTNGPATISEGIRSSDRGPIPSQPARTTIADGLKPFPESADDRSG